jgi:hypothetical protein
LGEIVETGASHPARIVAEYSLKEALQETHKKGSPPKTATNTGNRSMKALGHCVKRS